MKILICEDNRNFAGVISNYLSSQEDMEVVDIAVNGRDSVNKIINYQPDVVLLDIVMPELDGLGVMEKLVESNLEKMPKIILESAISQDKVIKEALDLGAYCFLLKPYELPALCDRIRTAYLDSSVAISKLKKNEVINLNESKELDVELEITNLMHNIGIPANVNGHQFLRESISMVVKDRRLVTGITKSLYPEVAVKFNTTGPKVERGIRHAIEICWLRGKLDILEEIFGYSINPERGKPTNSEFIAIMADKIRVDMRIGSSSLKR